MKNEKQMLTNVSKEINNLEYIHTRLGGHGDAESSGYRTHCVTVRLPQKMTSDNSLT